MSRMVQCPNCRAILQEPPPGNPYYKCGSCFTVLQAKHAVNTDGPQRPTGEEILDNSKQPPEVDEDAGSEFRRQKSMPGRLRRSLDEVEDEKKQMRLKKSSGNGLAHGAEPSSNKSGFGRQRTLPSKLPAKRGSASGKLESRDIPRMDFQDESERPQMRRPGQQPGARTVAASATLGERYDIPDTDSSVGERGQRRRSALQSRLLGGAGPASGQLTAREDIPLRPALKSSLKNGTGSSYMRQRTLPSKLPNEEEEAGHDMDEGEDDLDREQGDRKEEFRRTRTMPGKVPAAPPGSGILKKATSTERKGPLIAAKKPSGVLRAVRTQSEREEDEEGDISYLFRRQKTLPSLMSSRMEEEEEEEEDSEFGRADLPLPPGSGYLRQKTLPAKLAEPEDDLGDEQNSRLDVRIPTRLKALLDNKPNMSSSRQEYSDFPRRGAKGSGILKKLGGLGGAESTQIPARLQVLLDKKGAAAAASSSAAERGFPPRKLPEVSARPGVKPEGLDAKQAMREALLSGGRSQKAPVGAQKVHLRRISDPANEPRGSLGLDYRRHTSAEGGGQQREEPASRAAEAPQPPPQQEGNSDLPMLPPSDAPQVVACQHCQQTLAVPPGLPGSKKGVQKLRCGKCLMVSTYALRPAEPSPPAQPPTAGLRGLSLGDGPAPSRQLPVRKVSDPPQEKPAAARRPIPADDAERAGPGKQAGRARRTAGAKVMSEEFTRQVVVNGQALTDDMVARAEERSGPIHPGEYWYDIRAGFWGVMGGPCQGIIPPGIEDLGTGGMSADCAGGRTRVFVNGRELHRKDLEILRRRGLPDTPNKGYFIDVMGNVVDEDGQELRGLGRLAPSLEEKRRGAGMVVPS